MPVVFFDLPLMLASAIRIWVMSLWLLASEVSRCLRQLMLLSVVTVQSVIMFSLWGQSRFGSFVMLAHRLR